MNTKTFAQQSRRLLMDGVAKKLLYWGFNTNGTVLEAPQKRAGGYTFRGEAYDDENVPHLWESLKAAVQHKGIEVVVEEAAYTWFNRIMALRIMAKNGYEQPQLENAVGLEHTPLLLQKARQGQYSFLSKQEQERLKKIIGDYSKDQEAFAILLVGYCHSNTMLNNVFGKIDDYTELLLPDNMLQESGFLHLLNTTDAISDAEYQEVELIGWLYQFYISERKDEVFASFKKNKKAEAKDIPAATQIFTPNWIVKYMVQNTAGKIWLDKYPNSPLKTSMKYLVQTENVTPSAVEGHVIASCHPELVEGDSEAISSSETKPVTERSRSALINTIEDLTLIDPACGSGHILVEGFDLLYQMYVEEYYTPEEAVESILKNNLFGLDIDDRAAQLATFAILLKAAKVYRDIFTKGWLPNVYSFPEAANFSTQELKDFLGTDGEQYVEALDMALRLLKQGKNLGSVLKFVLTDKARNFIENRFKQLSQTEYLDINLESIFQGLKTYIPVLLILTKKYTAVVANPPYMGQKSMNAALKNYVNDNYPITKTDLMTVFMEVIPNLTQNDSRFALINLPSWLFLSSFEKIRKEYINNFSFDSLLHMGRGIFGIDFGSVAFAMKKTKSKNAIGTYFRLHERNFQHILYKDIEKLFLYSNGNVNYKYDFNQYRGEEGITEIPEKGTAEGNKLFYPNIPQTNFSKIPSNPIAYWVSKNVLANFIKAENLEKIAKPRQGMATTNNGKFVRDWSEVNLMKIGISLSSREDALESSMKWFPYNKGGGSRKWYGIPGTIVNFEKDGQTICDYIDNTPGVNVKSSGRVINREYYFKKGITWSKISSKGLAFRYVPKGYIFDVAGTSIFFENDKQLFYLFGLMNSKVITSLLSAISPTINFEVGQINKAPILLNLDNHNIKEIIDKLIKNSKQDWDSRETSWDFEKAPLLNDSINLKQAYQVWQEKVTKDFFQLHSNEEELNRIFIDIYGLQEELTPEVALKDITILQEELKSKDLEALEPIFREKGAAAIQLPINKAEVISQFISYAIGIYMGRYRLDKPGLNIAHPNPTAEELASYFTPFGGKGAIQIDEDAIIPLMGNNCNFPDDALHLVNKLLDAIWGHETRIENTNFIHDCLNKDLDKFLVNDFYKYHCGMYKKKPIYWLFSSKTGAFQVLVYMHRMNAFTAEKIRANYLLEHIKNLNSEMSVLANNTSNLNTQQAKRLDQVRKDIVECETYDMELKNIADLQISLDLDDGVDVNYKKFQSVLAKIK
ncbi:BREX-1 system adenine-specific DNA-methyltransferase PglX [Lutibacter sp. HS1-25]|uniref:BREX-1 system adenine-specific DNA-methyltransferase PglX n=1 Tax=Lutibacter sp. HS1-25 TaxID=2485000 RepID=UPI0010130FF1|nr:BREX-1 system adenine-specific DNA-methyltransferase PglX [Lutibacter sp. HS1-25]RXP53133.1 BREX-1 system adenine-specific DNA-methyltransferase PglX [Lutibacter sp. HS1-25]